MKVLITLTICILVCTARIGSAHDENNSLTNEKTEFIKTYKDQCVASEQVCLEVVKELNSYDEATFSLFEDLLDEINVPADMPQQDVQTINILALHGLGICRTGEYDIPKERCITFNSCYMNKAIENNSIVSAENVKYLELCTSQVTK